MPNDEPNDPADAVRRLLVELPAETSAQLLRLVHESKQRARGGGARDGNPAEGLFDLARISLKGLEELVKLSSHGFDQIADALSPAGGPFESGKPAQLRLRVAVPAGETATAGFTVTNPSPKPVEVSFTQPKLRNASGAHFPGDVSFVRAADAPGDGGDFALEAGKTGRFELLVCSEGGDAERFCGDAYVVIDGRVAGRISIEVDVRSPTNWHRKSMEVPLGSEGVLPLKIPNPFRHRRAVVHFSTTGFTASDGSTLRDGVFLRAVGSDSSMEISARETRDFELVVKANPNRKGLLHYAGKAYVLVDERVVLYLHLDILFIKPGVSS